jgi:hypothetical protein
MATKHDLEKWVVDALTRLDGSAGLVEVCKEIWNAHEHDLRRSGDLFYTWQYDVRWAAQNLRDRGLLKPASRPPGPWEVA